MFSAFESFYSDLQVCVSELILSPCKVMVLAYTEILWLPRGVKQPLVKNCDPNRKTTLGHYFKERWPWSVIITHLPAARVVKTRGPWATKLTKASVQNCYHLLFGLAWWSMHVRFEITHFVDIRTGWREGGFGAVLNIERIGLLQHPSQHLNNRADQIKCWLRLETLN